MSRPLRILFVLNAAGGGATQGIVELLKALPREAFEAFLVMPDVPNERQQAAFEALGATWRTLPMDWWNRKTKLPPAWRVLVWGRSTIHTAGHLRPVRQIVRLIDAWQIDLVYTATSMTIDGALAARLRRRPHLWHVKETIGRGGRVQFPLPHRLLVRAMAALSAHILVMTRFIGAAFEGHVPPEKVTLIYDGVDVAAFGGDRGGADLRRRLGVADGEVLVAMSASLSAVWKEHGVFLEMAAHLAERFPHVRFAAFGAEPRRGRRRAYDQPWRYYQRLRARADALGLGDRLIWAGFHPDIPQIMDALDVLVHPCAQEPFGRVAIEAMAAGRPVVGPHTGGIAESVADGETGLLVAPGNPAAFAEATARLITDAALRRRLGEAGRCRAATHFSLERHAEQAAQLIRAVTGPRPTTESRI